MAPSSVHATTESASSRITCPADRSGARASAAWPRNSATRPPPSLCCQRAIVADGTATATASPNTATMPASAAPTTSARGSSPAAMTPSPTPSRTRSATRSSTRSITRVPRTWPGGTPSSSRNATVRATSPARNGSVLLSARLARKGRTHRVNGRPGASGRSIHHHRAIRAAKPTARSTRPTSNGPGRAPASAMRTARQSRPRASSHPNASANARPMRGRQSRRVMRCGRRASLRRSFVGGRGCAGH